MQSGRAADLPQPFPLLSGMGSLFDTLNLQPLYLRPWAHQELSWSEESLQELARVRRAILALCFAYPSPTSGHPGCGTLPWPAVHGGWRRPTCMYIRIPVYYLQLAAP